MFNSSPSASTLFFSADRDHDVAGGSSRPFRGGGDGVADVGDGNNSSCAEWPLEFEPAEKVAVGLALAAVTAVTVIGNALVVVAVCVVKKLRQPSNYLLVSLAAADLSVALGVMPFAIATDLTGGKWLFGEAFCNVFIGMDVMCCTASIMTLCVISVDR
ncbi:5-hydroxytryptamine receptor 7-like [Ictalurus furcatus]|nr:5-hydroxytryptamine receptor 7-like [Ictalurus furcatus]